MKILFVILLVLFSIQAGVSQQKELKPLGPNLENYEYPYPVQFLRLPEQGQQLQMAYMDVKPKKANGKII